MLVRFSVENFLSFKNLTEFSMVAGKMTRHSGHIAVCNHKRLLKGAFIFGANASGKTNLIRAISFARNIVLNGIERTNCDKKFFRIDEDYYPGIPQAIKNAESFSGSFPELFDHLGTNLPKLLDILEFHV